MKSMVLIGSLVVIAAQVFGEAGDFEKALKSELLANHRRHIPEVTINGNEVTLGQLRRIACNFSFLG